MDELLQLGGGVAASTTLAEPVRLDSVLLQCDECSLCKTLCACPGQCKVCYNDTMKCQRASR